MDGHQHRARRLQNTDGQQRSTRALSGHGRAEYQHRCGESVRANGHPVVVYKRSFTPKTLGDAAGQAKGVKSGTVEGKCHPLEHSSSVRAEGCHLIRHGDLFWMNGS